MDKIVIITLKKTDYNNHFRNLHVNIFANREQMNRFLDYLYYQNENEKI